MNHVGFMASPEQHKVVVPQMTKLGILCGSCPELHVVQGGSKTPFAA